MKLKKIILIIEKYNANVDKHLLQNIQVWKKNVVEVIDHVEEREAFEDCVLITDNIDTCRLYEDKMAVIGVYDSTNPFKEFHNIKYLVMNLEEIEFDYIYKVWQRYHGLSWLICKTERCMIRETNIGDISSFYSIYSDQEIKEYLNDLYEDPEKEKRYIVNYIKNVYSFYGYGIWTIYHKEKGEIIGRAGLSMREGYNEPELGYVIAKEYRRKGYAEEVCQAILKYGKEELGFRKIQVLTREKNIASLALCKKLGFRYKEDVIVEKEVYQRHLLQYEI